MSDNQIKSAEDPSAEEGVPFVLHTQYVRDLSFENPNAPGILATMKDAPRLEVRLDVGSRLLHDRLHEIILKVNVNAQQGEHVAFVVELEYAGLASVAEDLAEDQVEPTLLIDGAYAIFPFARRVIADATRDGGFPPVLINPINFTQLYRDRKAAEGESA